MAMSEAYFYHMTATPLERTLVTLLSRSRERGWRVLVRSPDAKRLDWLDEHLWMEPKDSFAPHGIAGGPYDADQPILLTSLEDNPNAATCLITLDAAVVTSSDLIAMERICVLFDGNDPASLDLARAQWKSLSNSGAQLQYWAEDDGKWVKKATSGG
jgi:DNA polymerase III subunit chi